MTDSLKSPSFSKIELPNADEYSELDIFIIAVEDCRLEILLTVLDRGSSGI